jgi:hypothetical protein
MGLLAIGWEPEIRGLLTVIIGVVVLCGSIYLIMATNVGARLGFLITLTGLAGWMMLMGMVWWIYGIGLRGPDPSWTEVPGVTVLQDPAALRDGGAIDTLPPVPDDATPDQSAEVVGDTLVDEGYEQLAPSNPAFGQAQATAAAFLEEEEAFGPGGYVITDVYDIGGERYPKINDSLDFVAFVHTPHYVVVEARPLIEVRAEPGRAPATPEIDESEQAQYVYMVRDLGARRQPATVLTIGGAAIFLALCYLLNRRDRFRRENLEAAAVVARPA